MIGPQIDRDLISNKPSCYIFDIDGVMAEVRDILMTKKMSYEKRVVEYDQLMEEYAKALKDFDYDSKAYKRGLSHVKPIAPVKPELPTIPDSKEENKIDFDYFHRHVQEAVPVPGVVDLFINLAASHKVVILTGRSEKGRNDTLEWLKKVVIERGGDTLYRRINFQLIMRTEKEYALSGAKYKREKVLELAKNYNIRLILEDCPDIIKEYTELGFLVLSPNKEYYRIGQE